MVNEAFKQDLQKHLNKQTINTELDAGSTNRRYEPVGGLKKHNDKIHKESEYADKYKDLPFEFSKPKKQRRQAAKACSNCGDISYVSENCVGKICNKCKMYSSVVEV